MSTLADASIEKRKRSEKMRCRNADWMKNAATITRQKVEKPGLWEVRRSAGLIGSERHAEQGQLENCGTAGRGKRSMLAAVVGWTIKTREVNAHAYVCAANGRGSGTREVITAVMAASVPAAQDEKSNSASAGNMEDGGRSASITLLAASGRGDRFDRER